MKVKGWVLLDYNENLCIIDDLSGADILCITDNKKNCLKLKKSFKKFFNETFKVKPCTIIINDKAVIK